MRGSLENPEARDHFTNACRNIDMAELLTQHGFPEGTAFHGLHAIECLCAAIVRETSYSRALPQHKVVLTRAETQLEKWDACATEELRKFLAQIAGPFKMEREGALHVEVSGLDTHLPQDRRAGDAARILKDAERLRGYVQCLFG